LLCRSVGNHEYDYPYDIVTEKDPSGVSHSWNPTNWDGYVDSLGECGLGTSTRFRGPRNGNQIFWYSFEVGGVHVVMLSSEHDMSKGSPQGDFLYRDLLSVNRTLTPWVIVTLHRPVYEFQLGAEVALQETFRSILEPIFEETIQPDLVAAGHDHIYHSTFPIVNSTFDPNGPVYIVNGASGAMFTVGDLDPKYKSLVRVFNDHDYGISYATAINSTHLLCTWVLNKDLSVADEFYIVKNPV
jgi:acid phosphatase type 7